MVNRTPQPRVPHTQSMADPLPLAARAARAMAAETRGAFDFDALSNATLRQWLSERKRRSNVLIQCTPDTCDATVLRVLAWSSGPVTLCVLPGPLALPDSGGVLLLHDAASLTMTQQVRLYDWLSASCGRTQVISLTSAALRSMVDDGAYLEGLYYRLNVITINATRTMQNRFSDTSPT
jgi:hypothetical protein